MAKTDATVSTTNLKLISSDDKSPKVGLKAGMKLQVVGVSLVDSQLKKAKISASRLCGGTSTCVALVELGDPVSQPK